MKKIGKIFALLSLGVLGIVLVLLGLAWITAFKPQAIESVPLLTQGEAPKMKAGQPLKVLSWNVQFMAGKGYIFFFDMPGNKGPDERPSRSSVEQTLAEVARVIQAENPDVIALQEVDDGAARTDHEDQLARLQAMLPKEYNQSASAFYWKVPFVPHPRILGSVGLKLSILSRYQISSARSILLPQAPHPPVVTWFQFHRTILEAHFPLQEGGDLVVLNTHGEALIQDGVVKKQEVEFLANHLQTLSAEHPWWVLAGDMNMLPPGFYTRIPVAERVWFKPEFDMGALYAKYSALPSLAMLNSPDSLQYLTHFPNRIGATGLDKVIDYQFYSPVLTVESFHVRQADCLKISDHMPLVASYLLPIK